MVSLEHIENVFDTIIIHQSPRTDKCHDYPKARALRNFNEDDFTKETYTPQQNPHPRPRPVGWKSPRGRLQKIQHDLQKKKNYTDLDKVISRRWSIDLFIQLNSYLFGKPDSHGKVWKGKDRGMTYNGEMYNLEECSDFLSKAIQKSPSAQESFMLKMKVLHRNIQNKI